MTVFALMDEWIAAAGDSDSWLDVGLRLADRWQAAPGGGPGDGQHHLAALLAALRLLRPEPPARPDVVRLAAWFHHGTVPGLALGVDAAAHAAAELLTPLTGPEPARRVAALVRTLSGSAADDDDREAALLRSAHRAACRTPLTALPAPPPVQ